MRLESLGSLDEKERVVREVLGDKQNGLSRKEIRKLAIEVEKE